MKTLQTDLNRKYFDNHLQSQHIINTTPDYTSNYIYTNPSKESKSSLNQPQMRNNLQIITTTNAPITSSNVV